MTYAEYVENARQLFRSEFNSFLEKEGIEPLTQIVDSEYMLRMSERSLAIYPDSPSGKVLNDNGDAVTGSLTLSFYLDENAVPESEAELLLCLTAFMKFINEHNIGLYDEVREAYSLSMGTGYEYNGLLMHVESNIAYKNDAYDWE